MRAIKQIFIIPNIYKSSVKEEIYLSQYLRISDIGSKHKSSFIPITLIFAFLELFIAGSISSNTKQFSGFIFNFFAANKYMSGKSFPFATSSVIVIESK